MMTTEVLQAIACIGLLVLILGVCMTVLSGRSIGLVLGPIVAGKALAFLSVVFAVLLPARSELLTAILLVALFFAVLLTIMGIAVLLRSERFPEGKLANPRGIPLEGDRP